MSLHHALIALALAGGAVAAAPPAVAQSETGTRLGGRPAQLPDRGSATDRARVWVERYVACVVRRDPKRVAEVLGGEIGDNGPMDKLVQGGIYDACLSTGGGAEALAMNQRLLRGALYADRVTAIASRVADGLAATPPLAFPDTSGANAETALQTSLVRFGECVVRADSQAALAYVAAGAASEPESRQLAVLRPLLPNCIKAGQKVQLSASVLEGALAEAIWRMSDASGAGRQGTTR